MRRECLDHVIVLNEGHLRRILTSYLIYYHESRTHLSLAKDTPAPFSRPTAGRSWRCRNSVAYITVTSVSRPDQGWFLGAVCGGDEGAAGDRRALTKPFRLPGARRF